MILFRSDVALIKELQKIFSHQIIGWKNQYDPSNIYKELIKEVDPKKLQDVPSIIKIFFEKVTKHINLDKLQVINVDMKDN